MKKIFTLTLLLSTGPATCLASSAQAPQVTYKRITTIMPNSVELFRAALVKATEQHEACEKLCTSETLTYDHMRELLEADKKLFEAILLTKQESGIAVQNSAKFEQEFAQDHIVAATFAYKAALKHAQLQETFQPSDQPIDSTILPAEIVTANLQKDMEQCQEALKNIHLLQNFLALSTTQNNPSGLVRFEKSPQSLYKMANGNLMNHKNLLLRD